MKTSLFYTVLILLLSFNSIGQIDTDITTYSVDAEISDDYQVLCSFLDKQNKTHIASRQYLNDLWTIVYTVYDPATNVIETKQVYTGNINEKTGTPYITTDANNNPHIAFLIRRDLNYGYVSGNLAVMYVGDGDGDGIFETIQVSTNLNDPTDNTDNIYNCHSGGSVNIFFDNGGLVVSYQADYGSFTNWEEYYIFARRSEN